VKVRIGISPGRSDLDLEGLDLFCAAMVEHRFDSVWLSEVLTSSGLDPLIGLSFVAARYRGLKIGTTMLAPGRNPMRLAKSLASLDKLSDGRLLVTFVPGLTESPESDAIGVSPTERGRVMDELLPLLRVLLEGGSVSYDGPLGHLDQVSLKVAPVQSPLEFWLGGMAKSSLVRCGTLADGWLPSLCSEEQASTGRDLINQAADAAGRAISPEHFGVSVPYALRDDEVTTQAIASRRSGRNAVATVPIGTTALRTTLERFIDIGFSKFVLRPLGSVLSWSDELGELASAVGTLQS
jgi:probable F420-dependent oxidoreductase